METIATLKESALSLDYLLVANWRLALPAQMTDLELLARSTPAGFITANFHLT